MLHRTRFVCMLALVALPGCRSTPTDLPPPDRSAVFLENGPGFGCLIDRDGAVWCWDAQLTSPNGRPVARPFAVPEPLTALSLGFSHGCGVSDSGGVWCWGDNTFGQLGVDGVMESEPVRVEGLPSMAGVTAGGLHSCAWTSDGEAWCWGDNRDGQLGDGTTDTRAVPATVSGGARFDEVEAGLNTTCGVVDERLECWGDNRTGVVGTASDSILTTPTVAMDSDGVAGVAVGEGHVCVRSTGNDIYCWGRNDVGQVGDGTTDDRTRPIRVLPDGNWVAVDAGPRARHSCAIHREGAVFCWGENGWNQSGVESLASVLLPTLINSVRLYTSVSPGWRSTCALDPLGGVSCWGSLRPSSRTSSPLRVIFTGTTPGS